MVSFLTYGSFRNVLFSVQISGNFPDIFLLLLSKLISLWSEDIFCKISVPLHLLRLGFWSSVWLILLHVPCELEYVSCCGCLECSINDPNIFDGTLDAF